MRAIGLTEYLPVTDPNCLVDLDLPTPEPAGRDLLVRVSAISVNPVDTKVRAPGSPDESEPRVLGWDASGVVEAVGNDVRLFRPGDEVYYAGSIRRPGANSELHLVDERIVGPKPSSLGHAEAAALPLTSITAWEALFDRLSVSADGDRGKRILIVGGAGGVGSIAIQIAKVVAGLEVVATASRPETEAWCVELGADHVVNHRESIGDQLDKAGISPVDFALCLNDLDGHWDAMTQCVKPQGSICSIVRAEAPIDVGKLMQKSLTFAYELMFTRPGFETDDMIEQHRLLGEVARLVDAGELRTTLNELLSPISAANLREAHARLETGRTIGKVVLEGWG